MRRIVRRTIVTAGVVCGIVLAWVVSPLFSSRQTARVRIAVAWPQAFDETAKTAFYKSLTANIEASISSVLWSSTSQRHFTSINSRRSSLREIEITFSSTSDDKQLARAVSDQIAMRLPENHSPAEPAVRLIPPSWWDEMPAFPSLPLGTAGAALGLWAGWFFTGSLAPDDPFDE